MTKRAAATDTAVSAIECLLIYALPHIGLVLNGDPEIPMLLLGITFSSSAPDGPTGTRRCRNSVAAVCLTKHRRQCREVYGTNQVVLFTIVFYGITSVNEFKNTIAGPSRSWS